MPPLRRPRPLASVRKERRQDARAGSSDRMAERAGAAVDVHARMVDVEVVHGRHR